MLPAWSVSQLRIGEDFKGGVYGGNGDLQAHGPGTYLARMAFAPSVVTVAASVTPTAGPSRHGFG
jgi:hypothetical protein